MITDKIIMAAAERCPIGAITKIYTDKDGKRLDQPQPVVIVQEVDFDTYQKNISSKLPISKEIMRLAGYFYFYEVSTD